MEIVTTLVPLSLTVSCPDCNALPAPEMFRVPREPTCEPSETVVVAMAAYTIARAVAGSGNTKRPSRLVIVLNGIPNDADSSVTTAPRCAAHASAC